MSNLSLLVDCHKIITWLQDRKKLRKDWYNYLKAAEQKLKTLLKDRQWTINYPNVHEHINSNEQFFNYNDITYIIELLSQTPMGQKNLIFGYSNKTMKQWATLKKYMQNNTLHLLSVAKFIEQSLRFDLPALNKSIEGLDNQLANLKRKIDFNQNTIYQQTNALIKEKTLLGVEAQQQQKLNIEELIELLIRKGPHHIRKFVELCQDPKILGYLTQYNSVNEENKIDNGLDALNYFIHCGDEFLEVSKDPELGEKYSTVEKYRQFSQWKGSNQWDIQIQGQNSGEAEQLNAATIIQQKQFRQQLLYNLNTLLFFFKGLRYELSTASKGLSIGNDSRKTTTIVEGQADEAISKLQQIIFYLTSRKLTVPLELKHSKKAYQMMVSQFHGFQSNIKTMEQQIKSYRDQIGEIQIQRRQQAEKLNWLRSKVVTSKSKCEGWLSQLVKKDVKITGEINKLQ